MTTTITTMLWGGRVYVPGYPGTTALAVIDGAVAWLGSDDAVRGRFGDAEEVVRLGGALVTPAFVDAHVHATSAGLVLDGLELSGCTSLAECLATVRAFGTAHRHNAVVWGHGWDETSWPELRPPTRAELDEALNGRPAYLSRIDGHSALVTTALAASAAGAAGYSPTGPLSVHANHVARQVALAAMTPAQRRAAQGAFLAHAAALGVGHVHECAGPDISGVEDLRDLLASGPQVTVEVVGYWGQPVSSVDEARDVLGATGAHGLAGDLFCDGALGSRTAALRSPYADAPDTCGHAYLDADAIAAHVVACTEAGAQAGFHVIGDAAAAAVVAGFELAERRVGRPALIAGRHRLEHLELVDAGQAAALAGAGVLASMQPRFDEFWGGPDGMYARRLGVARAEPMNAFTMLAAAGVPLAFGSDAPVTPVGPWAAVRAAVRHHTPGSGLSLPAAFAAHTAGGHRAAGHTDSRIGTLMPGAPASYAIWETDGLDSSGLPAIDGALPRCLRTVVHGKTIFDAGVLT